MASQVHGAAPRFTKAGQKAGQLVPPHVLAVPWDGHGGVSYLFATDAAGNVLRDENGNPIPKLDGSGKQVPGYRVITVGYGYSSTDANSLDVDSIKDALRALTVTPMPYPDGSDSPYFQASSTNVIVIKGGTDTESRTYPESFDIGVWVHLQADGDVTIEGESPGGTVIKVGQVSPATVKGSRSSVQIGGQAIAGVPGKITIRPFGSAEGRPDPSQRGIVCELDQRFHLATLTDLDIHETTFSGFRVSGSGAAISNLVGTASGCHFENCRASSGGAISGTTAESIEDIVGSGRVRAYGNLDSCTFENCTAGINGGAVQQIGTASNCTFTNCGAEGSGGACYDVNTVSGGQFNGCNAGVDGGAIAKAKVVKNVTCMGCSAGDSGGALSDIAKQIGSRIKVAVDKGEKYVYEPCTIQGCTALQGGAIANCKADIADCFIDRNRATGRGGGGLFKVKGDIDRCSITRNSAVERTGGGLLSCSGKITNCIIFRNRAGSDGGGLHDCDGALLHLDILQNRADEVGGGARNCSGKIQNCIILDNWNRKGKVLGDWSQIKGDSNQLSNSSDPKFCFMPKGWSGRHNVIDDGSGPGFVVPPSRPSSPEVDPTTLDDFEILKLDRGVDDPRIDAQQLRLTLQAVARDAGKYAGVDDAFVYAPKAPRSKETPDIGAFEES